MSNLSLPILFALSRGGAGGGAAQNTHIGSSRGVSQVSITSSTGTGTTIPAADATASGVMSVEQVGKLNGVAENATRVIVENNLTSQNTTNALSAAQGKVLKDGVDALTTAVDSKQPVLVSGTSIRTLNGASLLGSGNIAINTVTDISATASAASVTISSSTGAGTTINAATSSLAGLLAPGEKVKLAGIEEGATANQTNAFLLNRQNHTGQMPVTDIADFNAAVVAVTETAINALAGGSIAASKYPYRTARQRVRVATFGDDNALIGQVTTPNASAFDYVTETFGGAGNTRSVGASNLSAWSTHLFYPSAKLVFDGGVSGQSTSQFLGRDIEARALTRKSLTDLYEARPDVVILRGVSIHDLTDINSGNYSTVVADTLSRHQRVIASILSKGIPVIDVLGHGYGDGAAATAAAPDLVRNAIVEINSTLKAATTTYGGMVQMIDPFDVGIRLATGKIDANYTQDGLSLNVGAQLVLAAEEAKCLVKLFGEAMSRPFGGYNRVTDPEMTSTVVWGGGVRPTSHNVTVSAGTPAQSKIEVISGKTYWTFDLPVTANTPVTIDWTTPVTINAKPSIVKGSKLGASLPFYSKYVGSRFRFTALNANLSVSKTGAGTIQSRLAGGGVQGGFVSEAVLNLVSMDFQVPETFTVNHSSSLVFSATIVPETTGVIKLGFGVPHVGVDAYPDSVSDIVEAVEVVVDLAAMGLLGKPHTLTVSPANATTVKIEASTDSGVTYNVVSYATQRSVIDFDASPLETPITDLRFSRSSGTGVSSFSVRG